MRHALAVGLSISILAGATTPAAYAQERLPLTTWVSRVGDDANPCSQSLPCFSFSGAIAKTDAGGEINCLDSGSFGQLIITKSITIDCTGVVAGVLANDTPFGIIVNAGDNDLVVLRNLEIIAVRPVLSPSIGVEFVNGKQLIIENTRISGFIQDGVRASTNRGAGNLVISNSTISNNGNGIFTVFGITTVSHSVIAGNGTGLFASKTGVVNADSNVLTGNRVAVQAGQVFGDERLATVRLSNNDVYGNLTGFGCGGGVLASAGNNRKGSNVGGMVPACSPTVAIIQQ